MSRHLQQKNFVLFFITCPFALWHFLSLKRCKGADVLSFQGCVVGDLRFIVKDTWIVWNAECSFPSSQCLFWKGHSTDVRYISWHPVLCCIDVLTRIYAVRIYISRIFLRYTLSELSKNYSIFTDILQRKATPIPFCSTQTLPHFCVPRPCDTSVNQ